jgi:AcrR family transcriptional regulator
LSRHRPRPPLSRDRILRAALAIVDDEGLDALTMRRLGVSLGVEAMSLYRWVPGKGALLDGIHELILEQLSVPARGRSWAHSVKAHAHAFRDALLAHPRALPVFATRPAVTQASLRHVEHALQLLHDAGFAIGEAINAMQSVVAYVVGHALSTHAPVPDEERTIPDYQSLDADTFPMLRAAARHLTSHDIDGEFAFGLDALVRGLSRGGSTSPAPH